MKHPVDYLVRSNPVPQFMKFTVSTVDNYGFGKDIAHFDHEEDAKLFIEAKKKKCPTLQQKEVAPELKP